MVVRYAPNHDVHQEWVYNDADIDAAKVVWARAMDDESNQGLVQYFVDRRAWLVDPDVKPVRISDYLRKLSRIPGDMVMVTVSALKR